MPIIKSSNKVVYFSHIPRCGGSSVEDYLQSLALVGVAFLDRTFDLRYSSRANSPQHIYGQDLARLFPMDFFDDYFTVVRYPISRFQSAFYFNQTTQKTIDSNIGINEFISDLCVDSVSEYGFYDGHFAPQSQFLYPNVQYRFFRLEEALLHKSREGFTL